MDALPHFIRDQATTYAYYSTDWLLFLVLREVMPSQDLGQLSIQDELEQCHHLWGEKYLARMGTACQMGATWQPRRILVSVDSVYSTE
eukprot:6473424-Amphidinium_carterae.1